MWLAELIKEGVASPTFSEFNQLELRYPVAFFNVNSFSYLGKGYGIKKPTTWTGGWVQTSCDLGWPRISNSILSRVRALVFGRNAIDCH